MYKLTDDFLYIESIPNITNISFVEGDALGVSLDHNTRTRVFTYLAGSTLADFSIYSEFLLFSPAVDLIPSIHVLNEDSTKINGVTYYFKSEIKKFYQYLVGDESTQILLANSVCVIRLNHAEFTNWMPGFNPTSPWDRVQATVDTNYVDILNALDSGVYAIYSGEDFEITNFGLDIVRPYDLDLLDHNVYEKKSIFINDIDIVEGFISKLESSYPTWSILPEVNKDTEVDPSNILVYEASLATTANELSSKLLRSSNYGRSINTKIPVKLEYLTNDIHNCIKFRDDCLLVQGLLSLSTYNISG